MDTQYVASENHAGTPALQPRRNAMSDPAVPLAVPTQIVPVINVILVTQNVHAGILPLKTVQLTAVQRAVGIQGVLDTIDQRTIIKVVKERTQIEHTKR
jgi:hypothetical protein